MKNLYLSIVCLLTISFYSYAQQGSYSFKESYKVSTPAQLAISSSDGNIEVVSSESNQIQVQFIVKKNNKILNINRSQLEKEVTLEVDNTPNSLKINVKYPVSYLSLDFNKRIIVSFKILVPKQTASDLKTSDGNISINGLTSNQILKTSDGNIEIVNLKGEVKGFTADGNIVAKAISGSASAGTSDGNISLENITGNVQSTTSDGNIELKNIKGEAFAKTSDGDIAFSDISGSLEAITSDGSIKGNVSELRKKLSLKTIDGDISAFVPANLGLNLNLKGSSIDAPLKNFSGKSGDEMIEGEINGGGIPVELITSGGNVSLNYR